MLKKASWILGEAEEVASTETFDAEREDENQDVGKEILSDSGITSPTEQGSVISDQEDLFAPSSWLGGLGTDFRNLAVSLKETAGDVVGFVHRSAMSVAAEIAELEVDYATEKRDSREGMPFLRLPWEILINGPDGEYYTEDEDLKHKIFLLSDDENSFLTPYSAREGHSDSEARGESPFVLDEPRIRLIRQLLDIDENLAAMHARISGRSRVRENLFWRNYFYHCDQVILAHERENAAETMIVDVSSIQDSLLRPPQTESQISRTKSDDDSSYVCVNPDVISPPTSLNWRGFVPASEGDLVVLGNPDQPIPKTDSP